MAKDGHVKKSGMRYHIEDFLTKTFSSTKPPVEETLKEGVLTIYEAHRIICEKTRVMHYTTVLRKVKSNIIPSYQVGRTFRIPASLLREMIEAGKLTYAGKPLVPNKLANDSETKTG